MMSETVGILVDDVLVQCKGARDSVERMNNLLEIIEDNSIATAARSEIARHARRMLPDLMDRIAGIEGSVVGFKVVHRF